MTKNKFVSPRLQCLNCKDIIWSHYEGHFNTCRCWEEATTKQREMFKKITKLIPDLEYEYTGRWSKDPLILPTDIGSSIKSIVCEYIVNKGIMIDAKNHYMRTSGKYELLVPKGNK